MAENVTSRVGRLISGTVNSLVDSVENMAPEMVMEEAVREVDRAIDDVRAELGKVISKQHMATTRLSRESRKHDEISENVGIALAEGREDLAEAGVSQILDIEAQIPVLEATISETKLSETELEGYIVALQARKREMKEQLAQFRDAASMRTGSPDASGDRGGRENSGSVAASVEKAEEAFERAVTGAGGVGDFSPAPDKAEAGKRAALDDLARQNRIKERLAAFKSKDS